MYIELDENNKIISSADWKFSRSAILTTKEIVRNKDGELVFKEEENV